MIHIMVNIDTILKQDCRINDGLEVKDKLNVNHKGIGTNHLFHSLLGEQFYSEPKERLCVSFRHEKFTSIALSKTN